MKQLLLCMAGLLFGTQTYSAILHRELSEAESQSNSFTWQVEGTEPFTELIVSWNAKRPKEGKYFITVRVQLEGEEWSEELAYASWASDEQRTFTSESKLLAVRTNEDAVELLRGAKGSGFSVTIQAQNGASLNDFCALFASHCDVAKVRAMSREIRAFKSGESIHLQVTSRSQMTLDHDRRGSLCSPTSTSCVVGYLSNKELSPLDFANNVWDAGFDIYGNWIFNVAEAYNRLQEPWRVYVARLDSFEPIYKRLLQKIPSVVTIRGPLKGSAMSYEQGHLVAIVGYDAKSHKILCMDPAFPTDGETKVAYDAKDFLEAWCRRGQIAYLFSK